MFKGWQNGSGLADGQWGRLLQLRQSLKRTRKQRPHFLIVFAQTHERAFVSFDQAVALGQFNIRAKHGERLSQ